MTFVYFIGATRSRAVKIGVSDKPFERLVELQVGNDRRLELLAQMPGDERYERDIHRAFASYRIRGEWFRREGELAEFVALLPAMNLTQIVPRRRAKELPVFDHAAFDVFWKQQISLIREAVQLVGVDKFAEVVGSTRSEMVRAIHERDRHFRFEWLFYLLPLLDRDRAVAILEHACAFLGLTLSDLVAVQVGR